MLSSRSSSSWGTPLSSSPPLPPSGSAGGSPKRASSRGFPSFSCLAFFLGGLPLGRLGGEAEEGRSAPPSSAPTLSPSPSACPLLRRALLLAPRTSVIPPSSAVSDPWSSSSSEDSSSSAKLVDLLPAGLGLDAIRPDRLRVAVVVEVVEVGEEETEGLIPGARSRARIALGVEVMVSGERALENSGAVGFLAAGTGSSSSSPRGATGDFVRLRMGMLRCGWGGRGAVSTPEVGGSERLAYVAAGRCNPRSDRRASAL